jgi:hypothetical protein
VHRSCCSTALAAGAMVIFHARMRYDLPFPSALLVSMFFCHQAASSCGRRRWLYDQAPMAHLIALGQ